MFVRWVLVIVMIMNFTLGLELFHVCPWGTKLRFIYQGGKSSVLQKLLLAITGIHKKSIFSVITATDTRVTFSLQRHKEVKKRSLVVMFRLLIPMLAPFAINSYTITANTA